MPRRGCATLARRLGGNAFLTTGIYVVLYLAVVFAINLPLSFYEGFVRLHAYGLSNQTLGKWIHDARSVWPWRWPSGSP